MLWHSASSFLSEGSSDNGCCCNVPRDCVTGDCRTVFTAANPSVPVVSFYLSGASCSLGHASKPYYLALWRSPAIPMDEPQQLTHTHKLSYMYPNKPDALPLTMPIKCAYEYVRKLVSLKDAVELSQRVKPTMHYLEVGQSSETVEKEEGRVEGAVAYS
ncbi:hypothetical protein ABL78_5945 [Leptomonas seymouri]|uniref:Uncharacterized protein n=1 Tax=Leptomonas seymouri TaxID=5684 RepID=A0A0N1HUF2_LEPSE|nr:hypothetical protein ABL78_5945 [Leptomonas seymouri]|eukprot:KPI85010.1 hypothetical protein ABL78_5945 [Leptomonas seymouri]